MHNVCVWMCRIWTLQFLLTLVHILIYFISFVRDRVVGEREGSRGGGCDWIHIKTWESERKRRVLTPAASASAAHNQIFVFPVEWKTIIYHIKRFIFYGNSQQLSFPFTWDVIDHVATAGRPLFRVFSSVELELLPQHNSSYMYDDWWTS